jgi:prolyl 4-hydroxylase
MIRPRLTAISRRPRLYVADGFATDDEMDAILQFAASRRRVEAHGIPTKRDFTGYSFELPVSGSAVMRALRRRLRSTLGFGNDFGATWRFRRYAPGEHHPLHLDTYEVASLRLVATAMLYLTDAAEGGETHFPKARPSPIALHPRRGRLALWFNHRPDGKEDATSIHESLPLVRGVKATITSFVYKPIAFSAHEPDADGVRPR